MDIRSFHASSSKSTNIMSSSEYENKSSKSDTECLEPSPAKRQCSSSTLHEKRRSKYQLPTSNRKYNKKWNESFTWLTYNDNFQGAFCKVCRKRRISLQKTGGTWISRPFKNCKKAIEKMKAHAKSEVHILSCEAEKAATRALQEGSIIQQLQQIGEQEKMKNMIVIKALIHCTHFLAIRHIPHMTNFDQLVDLIVSCGVEDFRKFLERTGKNASYTTKIAVVEFIEAVGLWAEENLLKRLHQASCFSLMEDECTDVTTVEELSLFCHWVEDEVPVSTS